MENTDKGIAIKYSGEIPYIVANAKGILLEKLLEIAKDNNITVYRDPDLTEILYKLNPGSEIPDDLFRAVSEVLAYCYQINIDFRKKLENFKG